MGNYVKTPAIFQMEATECGAASLAIIFAYFGKNIPLEQMRIETGVSRDGCNAGNLMRAAKRNGLECHGYRKEPDALRNIKTPCIIHWNFEHFVVFEGFKGKNAYINDPAMGRRRLSYEELDEGFTGVVLTFKPRPDFVKEKERKKLIGFVKKRTEGQYGILAKLLFIGFLLVFPGVIIPVLSQIFLDDVLLKGNDDWFSSLILFMSITILIQICLMIYRNRILARFQKKMVLLSGREFIAKLFRLPISFYEQRYIGDLVGRVENSANVNGFLAGELAENILNIFIVSFYLVLLLLYSPVLTAIALGTVIINAVIIRLSSNKISTGSIKFQQDSGKLAGAVCAGLNITSTIKASGAENEYVGRILGYSARAIATEQRLSKTQKVINAIPDALKMLADVVILILGGLLVIDGKMTVGMLVAFTVLFGSFSEPIEKLTGFIKDIESAKADIGRVEDILSYKTDWKFDEHEIEKNLKTKLEGTVELKDISFGYNKLNPPVISDFSFKITCGSSIAIVGTSGCGKSTASKIISGLYEPWTGQLLFDGRQANEIPNEVLNASISTVSQNINLFSGSIRDNLTMWNSNILESDMIAAAKDACIHDTISQKPGAYEYQLSEGAANLSGGQRQRLEIARALVTNPTILIMDEATSALDPIIEKKIMDNIKRRGCTCIVIAHRLSAIRDCDQIVVMDSGKIVQKGTHEELLKIDGLYNNLIQNL